MQRPPIRSSAALISSIYVNVLESIWLVRAMLNPVKLSVEVNLDFKSYRKTGLNKVLV